MKKYKRTFRNIVCLLALSMALPACEIEEIPDPNNSTLEDLKANPTVGKMNNLVVGSESGMRNALGTYLDAVSLIGREIYRFSGSEPRFTGDLLGFGNTTLDPNVFYITNPWSARYRVVNNLNVLMDILQTSDLVSSGKMTEAQRQGYLGFAKTIQAHQLLMNLTMTHSNGIRIDVKNAEALGPIVGRDQALASIATLLDEAKVHLDNAGETFAFPLSDGYDGFKTPETFEEFNRALASRVAVYQGNWNGVLANLDESFLDLSGNFGNGVYYAFGTGTGDQRNPVFSPKNATGEVRIAHPTFIADANPQDDRLSKVSKRKESAAQNSLKGDYDAFVYKSNIDRVPIIRNEELILLYAGANIQNGTYPEAVRALDVIRTGHNLAPYSGDLEKDALIDEMLEQRRYSLYFEGHRWIDMRRYNKLDELPIDRKADKDRPGDDDVWTQFPIPFAEGK